MMERHEDVNVRLAAFAGEVLIPRRRRRKSA
jgi:hypothetical protein